MPQHWFIPPIVIPILMIIGFASFIAIRALL
jgi:hypothetical protein